ncbi:LIMLP_15305 family protein [Leptospira noguchii]|uniref:Uncharacterized protein n=1 Tax=Leptospira noguchii serovar Autumnalis str. ZUN142 TaxID=1085540 RepID=M6UJ53_9LEPT|nr:hypothetical protein [Leptospira noguchii]EMO29054.1 hypothetical protein LEP1GSC170_4357 [Leptospira interrogans serovar Bataviae str. HAI135]EMO41084.1 hypothetical protein LEP1GSC186_4742 [Leptospira noguchii serovar Autumnalis str. ZUN142]EMS82308.1 hypothetical protein LEP1GSC074_3191 [Leptospira noguchii str. Hook]EMS84544.1 hypothetical protein LEP1GSC073_0687 [Leptospira noguchii str. Cascata]UOG48448.1 hypothetical protein MAL00_15930 [Leptospira noguchii]
MQQETSTGQNVIGQFIAQSPVQNLISRYKSERGKIRSFMEKLPLYSNALKDHEFQNADSMLRKELASKVSYLKESIRRLEETFVLERKMELIGSGEIAVVLIDKLAHTIQSAGYGLNGLGTGLKATREELEKLAEFDFSLFKEVEEVESKIQTLGINSNFSIQEVRDKIGEIRSSLDGLENVFRSRKELFLKL